MIQKKYYQLVDFSPTHNQLLFRSTDYEVGINYDLLFEGVDYLGLPLAFDLIDIKLKPDEVKIDVEFPIPPHLKTVIVEHSLGQGFAVLHRVLYQTNKLMPTESSIPIKKEKPLTQADILRIAEEVRKDGYLLWQKKNIKNDWEILI